MRWAYLPFPLLPALTSPPPACWDSQIFVPRQNKRARHPQLPRQFWGWSCLTSTYYRASCFKTRQRWYGPHWLWSLSSSTFPWLSTLIGSGNSSTTISILGTPPHSTPFLLCVVHLTRFSFAYQQSFGFQPRPNDGGFMVAHRLCKLHLVSTLAG